MENNDFRAKQFLPFDALKGFYEAIGYENIERNDKKVLSEDMFVELDKKINSIKKGDNVLIRHYCNFDYIETTGIVKNIDKVYKKIYLLNSVIDIEDIIDIKKVLIVK